MRLFYSKGVFIGRGGITNFCQLYNLQTECSSLGVFDEFCLVEVLLPNMNLLTSGEHITNNPIVAVNFYEDKGQWKLLNLLVRPSNGYSQGYQRCM